MDRAQGGLGIGLTLVRRLTEMHGGAVDASSAGTGHGCTFTVCLPLAEPVSVSTDEAPALALSPATEATPAALQRRILIVDDNIDGAESLSMLFAMRGHVTRTVHTGPAAIQAVAEFEPQIVFLDIGLPGLNGFDVARRVRHDYPESGIVLVALTGWGSEDDRNRTKAAGFDHHLTKPVNLADVEKMLAAFEKEPVLVEQSVDKRCDATATRLP